MMSDSIAGSAATSPAGVCGAVRRDGASAPAWERACAPIARDGAALWSDAARITATGWAGAHTTGDGLLVCGAAHLVGDDALASYSRSRGALATVAALYRRHGLDAFARLNGQFWLALYDAPAARLVLVTDRFCTRVLYYREESGCIRFSSHLPALSPGRSIDPTAIVEYLLYQAVPHPRTAFAGVAKLPPASLLVADASGLRVSSYWDMAYPEERDHDASHWARTLRGEIEHAVRRYVQAESDPASVGAFLSGGTDSSTVAGVMRAARGVPIRTFSIGYAEAGYDELRYARAAVRHFGLEQHEHVLTPQEAFAALPAIATYYQEPFGNSSALPTYICARGARERGVRVLFAGDGGDELFAGNTRYKSDKILGLYQRVPRPLRHGLTDPLARAIPAHWPLLGLVPRYVRRSNLPNPRRFFSYNFLLSAPLPTLLAPELLAAIDPAALLAAAEDCYRRSGPATAELNRLMHLDLKLAIADNDIRKVSGMTELAGVEVRYPLLDARLAELSGRIPSALKLRGLRTRYLFKRALADFLPPEILAKAKHGFGAPIAGWMKSDPQWRPFVADLLHDRRTRQRGYLQPRLLEELWRQHETATSAYFGDILWPVVMLELWQRRHVDASA